MKFVVCLLLAVSASASPVERVVNLLKDLQTKTQNDGKVEEQIYNKYACWCEKTSARKGADIEKAQDDLRALGQTILKLKGKVATLTAEIEMLAANIKKNEEEQAAATSLRQKENEEFTAETTELKQAIAALQRATQVIVAGASQDSFLQSASAVRDLLQKLPTHGTVPKAEHVSLLSELAKGKSKYAPQSATVQGILKDMYETFTNDLETSTDTEATANRDFESFIATKTVELNEMKALKEKKEGQKAEAEAQLADTTQIYDDTEAQMNADIEFFDATKSACNAKAAEWKTRSDMRAEELRGIAKALEILTADSARELFGSAIKAGKETRTDASFDSGIDISPAFLQLAAVVATSAPQQAYVALRDSARKSHSLRLAALAVRIKEAKVGHFDAVIKAIDEMVVALKEEDAADIAKRDQCKEQYTLTASVIANITWLIEKNVAKIDKLEGLIEKRTQEKLETIQLISETEAQIVAMTEQRTAENAEFLHKKSEDVAAVELLLQARAALAAYYKNNTIDMGEIQGSVKFLQGEPEFTVSADQAPDAVFSGTDKRADESKGIVSMLTMIIQDLNDEISNGMKNEAATQMEFEKQLAAATKLKEDLITKKENLETTIARLGEEKSDEHMLMEQNQEDLNDEVAYKKSITPDCDWIVGAFEERSKKRTNEMNGLSTAKELLAGMNPSTQAALLQQPAKAVPIAARKVRFLGLGA